MKNVTKQILTFTNCLLCQLSLRDVVTNTAIAEEGTISVEYRLATDTDLSYLAARQNNAILEIPKRKVLVEIA